MAVEATFLAVVTFLAWRFRWFEKLRFFVLEQVRTKWWRGPVYCAALVLFLRGVLLPTSGIPVPGVHDEYSYLLMADTFAHFRMTNPTPAAWEHFETFHVNMVPTYHSKYQVAQGVTLAFGQLLFGQPWAGVFVSAALMAAAITWALQAFVPNTWAFLGGVLCVLRLGVVGYWVDSYWGGTVAALGGALALGGAARLIRDRQTSVSRIPAGVALGAGLALLATSRPFEGLLFSVPLAVVVLAAMFQKSVGRKNIVRATVVAVGMVTVCLCAMLYYNYRCTGHPLTMPYNVYEKTYGSTPLFLWGDPNHAAYRHEVMESFYRAWVYSFYSETRTWDGVLASEVFRYVKLWDFFIGTALIIPVTVGAVVAATERRYRLVFWCALATLVAYSLAIFFAPHYFAPATVAVYGFAVFGLWKMWHGGTRLMRALAGSLCLVAIFFGILESELSPLRLPVTSERPLIAEWVSGIEGKHLLLVSYNNPHEAQHELVYNGADIPGARIVWARKMSDSSDRELCQAYPGRMFWDVWTDDRMVEVKPSQLCNPSSTGMMGKGSGR